MGFEDHAVRPALELPGAIAVFSPQPLPHPVSDEVVHLLEAAGSNQIKVNPAKSR
jgi:hypothetical protein